MQNEGSNSCWELVHIIRYVSPTSHYRLGPTLSGECLESLATYYIKKKLISSVKALR
jgi:hypothetical protein